MSNPMERFVVPQLVPENRQGGGIFALSNESVAPIRMVRGPDGIPREETICTLAKSARFVDRDGNVCTVPLRTGRVMSNDVEAVRYEQVMLIDQLRGGSIPLEVCPHTMQFVAFKPGQLVPNPNNVIDCGGHPEGCQHMQAVIDERRAVSRAKWQADQRQVEELSKGDVKAMFEGFAEAFGDTLGNALDAHSARQASKQGLRGKGEKYDPATGEAK